MEYSCLNVPTIGLVWYGGCVGCVLQTRLRTEETVQSGYEPSAKDQIDVDTHYYTAYPHFTLTVVH